MTIMLNGKKIELNDTRDIQSVLNAHSYAGKIVAVAHNGVFVPKSSYGQIHLKEGDALEILAPMQGG